MASSSQSAKGVSKTTGKSANRRKAKSREDKHITARCSTNFFQKEMTEMKKLMTEAHLTAIEKCPFGHFLNLPSAIIPWHRLEAMIGRYDATDKVFTLGKDIRLSFPIDEFSVVLGLHSIGVHVADNTNPKSETIKRLFVGRYRTVSRSNILYLMKELLRVKSNGANVDDLVRLYILFVFCNILFSNSNYTVPSFLHAYVDDLGAICDYAWGKATYQFLVKALKTHIDGKKYIDGCIYGLVAWLHERVPNLEKARGVAKVPRCRRWMKCKGPFNLAVAEKELGEITDDMVAGFYLLRDEEKFRLPIPHPAEELIDEVARLKVELRKKDQMIEGLLQRRGSEVEHGSVEEDDVVKESDGEGEDEVSAQGDPEVEEDLKEESVEAGPDGSDDVDSKFDVFDDEQLHHVELQSDEAGEQEAREGETTMTTEEQFCSERTRTTMEVPSIVTAVQTRTDRKKKRDSDFVTPPPTTTEKRPKRARKGDKKVTNEAVEVIEGEDEGDDPVLSIAKEVELESYRGRADYCGRDLLIEDQANLIDEFMNNFGPTATVWRRGVHAVQTSALLDLLFDKALKGQIIDAYMDILCSPEYRERHSGSLPIGFLPTFVASTIHVQLGQFKNQRMEKASIRSFCDNLQEVIRNSLDQLKNFIGNGCRYVLIPLNREYHWHLLIIDFEKDEFLEMNSMRSPLGKSYAKKLARFFKMYLAEFLQYKLKSEKPIFQFSRQQGNDLDCGVFVCLWAECFTMDDKDFWQAGRTTNMSAYRASIAATILADARRMGIGFN